MSKPTVCNIFTYGPAREAFRKQWAATSTPEPVTTVTSVTALPVVTGSPQLEQSAAPAPQLGEAPAAAPAPQQG